MITKLLRRKGILYCGLFVSGATNLDNFEKYKKARNQYAESGWERVKSIFKTDDFGYPHPDLVFAIQMAEDGLLAGGVIGGFLFCRNKTVEFIDSNDASKFGDTKDAYRQMYNFTMKGFGKGALKFGPRIALFFGGFSLFTSCFELYRNKHGIAEYVFGGTITGALLRFHYGLRGMFIGGVVGSALGAIAGAAIYSFLKLTNQDMIEYKYYRYSRGEYSTQNLHDFVLPTEEKNTDLHSSSTVDQTSNLSSTVDQTSKSSSTVDQTPNSTSTVDKTPNSTSTVDKTPNSTSTVDKTSNSSISNSKETAKQQNQSS